MTPPSDGGAATRIDPWIGSVSDGSRRILEVMDDHGRVWRVTINDILNKCVLHDSVESARSALAQARAGQEGQRG